MKRKIFRNFGGSAAYSAEAIAAKAGCPQDDDKGIAGGAMSAPKAFGDSNALGTTRSTFSADWQICDKLAV